MINYGKKRMIKFVERMGLRFSCGENVKNIRECIRGERCS